MRQRIEGGEREQRGADRHADAVVQLTPEERVALEERGALRRFHLRSAVHENVRPGRSVAQHGAPERVNACPQQRGGSSSGIPSHARLVG